MVSLVPNETSLTMNRAMWKKSTVSGNFVIVLLENVLSQDSLSEFVKGTGCIQIRRDITHRKAMGLATQEYQPVATLLSYLSTIYFIQTTS